MISAKVFGSVVSPLGREPSVRRVSGMMGWVKWRSRSPRDGLLAASLGKRREAAVCGRVRQA